MKWMTLVPLIILLSSCVYTTGEVIEYRRVAVTPVIVTPVYRPSCLYYAEPVDTVTTITECY